ncbi:putative O-glycosylation ligase, exosortase A system-associated [Aquincola sp. MAHUQ-54]|uniref:O-glycosylation ligase, exosortase A system-associated n=1 Tax=Aquincola agrisoli TaxID=3119538 RepID=A0AAW9QL49_9BURK
MRDILVMGIIVALVLLTLRRPWIGVLAWCWISLMNPHRYTYGFAYTAPVAAMAAGTTLLALVFYRQKKSPFQGAPTVWLLLFFMWVTVSWLMGLDYKTDYLQWDKVMKVYLMVFVALAMIHSRLQIVALAWVCALSLALLGAKGGLFTLAHGGSYHVWGPPDSFIADNNEFALALVMTIPLLRFCQLQMPSARARLAMTAIMLLCAISVLGSQSRGGLLAISAMTLLLWWRGHKRMLGGVFIALAAMALLAFMPDTWTERMNTIGEYQEDESAQGRFSAWWVSWGVAKHYLFGIGFNLARPELFQLYSPTPQLGTPVAHSIYFQVMGHHGFIGFFLFVMIWISTWRMASKLRKEAASIAQARWCFDLAGMAQASLLGYLVGGSFLSLSYFDLPYYIMAMVVLARAWVRNRGWETETHTGRPWQYRLGLVEPLHGTPPAAPAGRKPARTSSATLQPHR